MAIELGLGLVSIGRPWGHKLGQPPPEDAALALLEGAARLGIRFFDTAPAYGTSESIVGKFVPGHPRAIIATKMGEWWDAASGASTVDHRYASLQRSIERSLELLGRIDLLQVHKATAENLRSADVARAVEYARGRGVAQFGASISDLAAAEAAAETGWCTHLQFPFSQANTRLAPIFPLARQRGLKIVVNRPFAMGELAPSAGAFAFIREQDFDGVVLTGTRSITHLQENLAAFSSRR